LKLLTCLVALLALLVPTACSAVVPGAAAPARPASPGQAPAPARPTRPAFGAYLDPSEPMPNLAGLAEQTGLKHVVLSFVLAKGNACDPAWFGTEPLDSLKADTDLFRAAGGSITAATGGAEGTYIENACGTAADLAGAYTKILDATGTNLLDVDIEHDVQIDKVIDALGQVQRARGADITLTLPVDLDGLGPGQLNLVKKAAATNVALTVNVMDMDFDASGDWGTAMVRAAKTMLSQLRKVYPKATQPELYRMLGITMMIGRNDNGAVTQPDDAQTVLDFAKTNGVGRIGIWSLGRDLGTCAQEVEAQPNCSGIAQQDYQFTRQLATFTGPTPA
jgi:chitinase